jgi:hypothetical protein
MSAWELLGETVDVVEVAVRLVFVFFVQLVLVESLIVKRGRCGGVGTRTGEKRIKLAAGGCIPY